MEATAVWDRLLTILGAVLAALLGGGLVTGFLQRRSAKETIQSSERTAELTAITARLGQHIDTLEASLAFSKTLFDQSCALNDELRESLRSCEDRLRQSEELRRAGEQVQAQQRGELARLRGEVADLQQQLAARQQELDARRREPPHA
jgi:chromosome segregation ATPase